MSTPLIAAKIDEAERCLRRGLQPEALALVLQVAKRRLPRALRARAANLARRLGRPSLSLRWLGPVVGDRGDGATADEIAEYAGALVRLRVLPEAERWLRPLDSARCPKAGLFLAFSRIAEWDYAAAIPLLEGFIANGAVPDYERQVARVNLAAALVAEQRFGAARELIGALQAEARHQGHGLLQANCMELAAQNEILAGEWTAAERCLASASGWLAGHGSLDSFFVEKWQCLLRLHRAGATPPRLRALASLRREAERRGHAETVREADLHRASATRDVALFRRVYFGTPYPAYRRRVAGECRERLGDTRGIFTPPYELLLGSGFSRAFLDLATGEHSGDGEPLKPGHVPHGLLGALHRDFYRSQALGELYSALFPGDAFSPSSSPHRVYQACRRLRAFFSTSRLPLLVEERRGFYRLVAVPGHSVRLVGAEESAAPVPAKVGGLWERFARRAPAEKFTAREFAATVGTSDRSAQRYLGEALRAGLVTKVSGGPRAAYLVASGTAPHARRPKLLTSASGPDKLGALP